MSTDSTERDDAYARSLEAHGIEDVQPLYRRLLAKLREKDSAAYEEAVDRYRSDVEDAIAGADDSEPLEAWLAYGRWLARRFVPGTVMEIRETGRAEPAADSGAPGRMLIHLPDDGKSRGFVLAMPSDASAAQRETAALICE